jgi:hypothetical protein
MAFDLKAPGALYKRLLRLYPQAFRERFGESMEQTFTDLCNERQRQTVPDRLIFLLWIFGETTLGMIKEHIQLITRGETMKSILRQLGPAALISFLLLLPFMILELVNNRNQGFPLALFVFMWLLPTAFIAVLVPVVRTARAGDSVTAKPITLFFRVAFLIVVATVWGWGFVYQLPCFLGVPNCD